MIIKKFEVEFDGVKSSISMVARSEGLEDNIVGVSDYKILKSCAIIPDTGQENIMDILIDFLRNFFMFSPKTTAITAKYTLYFIVEDIEYYCFMQYSNGEIERKEIYKIANQEQFYIEGIDNSFSIMSIINKVNVSFNVLDGKTDMQNLIPFIEKHKELQIVLLIKWIDFAKHPRHLIEFIEKYHKLCGFQIIFTTYNVKIMDRRIMRDDQIVLVQNGKTSSLADYEIDKKYIILDNLYLQGAFY